MGKIKNIDKEIELLREEVKELRAILKGPGDFRWKRDLLGVIKRKQDLLDKGFFRV